MDRASPPPRRIVSLCPSVTETLFALGAGDRVVGRTRFCVHPAGETPRIEPVGGTKTVEVDRVLALQPDLIVAVREENEQAQVEELARHAEVLLLDPVDIRSAVEDVVRLGARIGASEAAADLAEEIGARFAGLPRADGIPVVYLIWRKPLMAVGGGTYIGAVLEHLGLVNLAAGLAGRYPILDAKALNRLSPRLVLASSEPFPFREQHLTELRARFPGARPVLVDGEMFGWHGARMSLAARYFEELVPRLAAAASP